MTPGSKDQGITSGELSAGLRRFGGGAGLLGDFFAPGDLVEGLAVVGGEEAHEGAPHAESKDQAGDEEGAEDTAILLEVHVEGGDHEKLGGGEDEQGDEDAAEEWGEPIAIRLLGDEDLEDGDDEQDEEDEDGEARGGMVGALVVPEVGAHLGCGGGVDGHDVSLEPQCVLDEVHDGENDNPHDVDEVPVEAADLGADEVGAVEAASDGAGKAGGEPDDADEDVGAVET